MKKNKNIDELIQELNSFNKNLIVRIEHKYMYDLDGTKTSNTVVMFGNENNTKWRTAFLHKITKNFVLEPDIKNKFNDYYECFEGGFESDIASSLQIIIDNIKNIMKGNNNE